MSEALTEGRMDNIKEDLPKLVEGDYYDTNDYAGALCEVGNLADELVEEVERLQAMEARLKSLMAYIRNQIDKDRKTAAAQGNSWLGVNTHTISANLLDTDLQNLERVLNG